MQRAQELYQLFPEGEPLEHEGQRVGKQLSDGTEVFLFHARFPANRRQAREDVVLKIFGESGSRNGTKILIPGRSKKNATPYEKRKARLRFRRRAAIEPVIGHLKSDYGLVRNYLRGHMGDGINLMLAAAAFNFSKLMKELASFLFSIFWLIFFSKNTDRGLKWAPV